MNSMAVIAGVGAQTPIGLSAMESAFMYRTGLPAMREAPILNAEEEPITLCTVNTLPTHALAGERALTLGIEALHDCTFEQREALTQMRLLILCCIDEFMTELPQGAETAAQFIANGLRDEARNWFDQKPEILVQPSGPGGFGAVLPQACERLAKGEIQAILLGGMHSDYHPLRIQKLEADGRLFSRDHLDSVLPAEGAAFVLLTTAYLARRLGLWIWGTVHAVGAAYERAQPDNDESAYEAAGMTVALRTATAEVRSEGLQVGWQLNDVGFEQYRIAEWQAVALRSHELWCSPERVDSPLGRLGYQGGATLPLHMVLASEAWRRGWAPHERVVSLTGSDSGARTAVLMSSEGASK
jgi:3-oxoacyl-[acyl-carrier-protein] synthase I